MSFADKFKFPQGENMQNWKTTAAGMLSAFMGAVGPLVAFVAALQAMKPTPNYTLAIAGALLLCCAGIARSWIGLLQDDAQSVPAIAQTILASGGLAQTAGLEQTVLAPTPAPTK